MTPEEMIIGACLLTPDSVRFAATTLDPADFQSPAIEGAFRAAVQLSKAGHPVEPFSVHTKAQELGVRGLELADLYTWMQQVGSSASITYYAEQVKEAAARRRLTAIATRLLREAQDETAHPTEAAQHAADALKEASTTGGGKMTTRTLGQILNDPEGNDWIVPGLLEKGDRLVITGFEGGGKTTWVRQMTICMAAGIHPTTLDHLAAPLTVLVIDAENSEKQWRRQTRGMAHTAAKHGTHDPRDRVHIKAGERLDITKDSTLGEVHRLIDVHQPDVLAIGPFYKLVSTGVNNDQDAAPLIMALDSLRERGVAMIMEAHAKKGDHQSGARDLAPRGSAALMGWPEFGFGIQPVDETRSEIVKWRGDRDTGRDWPRELMRGGPFPWTGETVSPERRRGLYGGIDF